MSEVRITKAPTGGEVEAIVSKSAAHRLLIAGFLSGLDLRGKCEGLSEDITATRECLLRLGDARASANDTRAGAAGTCEVPCKESGSTLRFLIPLAGALGIESDFVCQGRLPDRPMGPFLDCLAEHGCTVEGRNPKHLSGKLTGGTFTLPGNISSQYVTGLLMALPLLREDSRIVTCGRLQSRPYVDLTLRVLQKAGIAIKETENEFMIPGGQNYSLADFALDKIEGDWSGAAFWIAMDAMLRLRKVTNTRNGSVREAAESSALTNAAQRIICKGLDPESAQGDKAIAAIAEKMLTAGDETIDIDVADIPDLVPALSALSCSRPEGSVTNIVNAGRLRFKESDRLHAVTVVLTGLGADIQEHEESLTIMSKGSLKGGEADSFGDHRIAMMAAQARCISEEPIVIIGAEAVNKSYPRFFEDYQKLGGEVQWM